MRHIFIIGSKGIPGAYGGYETFVDKLTEYQQNVKGLKYHVACKSVEVGEFKYNNARCFKIKVPNIGPAQAIYYDVKSLSACCKYVKEHQINNFVIYILACRIGPFMDYFYKKVHKLGGFVYVNPDGHEWMRAKWSFLTRKYWKFSERLMVKHCDLLICDSINIERYIQTKYKRYTPKTTYISYGAEIRKSKLKDNDSKILDWFKDKALAPKSYYLVVGRFVPENNYEIMIKEFMKSKTEKSFALITNVSDKFLKELKKRTNFDTDPRIKFVGTVYDQELLMKIRENAFAYFHGHEVGGTNPSLLEALASTDLNLLLDVEFNREVAEEGACYWKKDNGNLAKLIDNTNIATENEIVELGRKSKNRIVNFYTWEKIVNEYEQLYTK